MVGTKTFTYELDGLSFTILLTETGGVVSATITVNEGCADFNALYWGDSIKDSSSTTLAEKKPQYERFLL